MRETNEVRVLAGQKAYDLYKQGREAWNDWADEHAGWRVNFKGWDFSNEEFLDFRLFRFPGETSFVEATFGDGNVDFAEATFGKGFVDFAGVTFGKGFVDFAGVTFGDGLVNFYNANFGDGGVGFPGTNFGDGNVNFSGATFGDGGVEFTSATFGDGNVDFKEANFGDDGVSFFGTTFGNGYANFYNTKFGDGGVDFAGVTFGDGNVSFLGATFGDGYANFAGTTFGKGNVCFLGVTFGDGGVDFAGVTFGDGNVDFKEANFGGGSVDFTSANFGGGNVDFKEANFGDGDVNFFSATFGDGLVTFIRVKFGDGDTLFRGALFAGTTLFDDVTFPQVPDFRQAHFDRDISLEGMSVAYKQEATSRFLKKAAGQEDASRFRRLRRMAVEAKDHTRELAFFAQETRARYGHELNAFQYFPFFLYRLFSDFGRSLCRPLLGLFIVWILAAEGLHHYSHCGLSGSRIDAYMLSLSNALPFLNWGRSVRPDYLTALYGETVSQHLTVSVIIYGQGFFSLIFIFLIGLALRNKLRL